MNSRLVYFLSKKQTSEETYSFESEFVAMKQYSEYLRGPRYKVRMMGIPVNGPFHICGDNQSDLTNTTEPGSALKKQSQSVSMREWPEMNGGLAMSTTMIMRLIY
jgi:hypothetical protein